MRKASPVSAPPVPATNSATTAPISASPPLIRNPARKYGRGGGSRRCTTHLAGRATVQSDQRQQIAVGAVEPDRGVRDNRKKRDDPGANQECEKRLAHPHGGQPGQRGARRHPQGHPL